MAEGTDDAAGMGDGVEEFGGVRAGEEDVEPVGVAGGGVSDGGDEPGLAARKAGFGGSRAGRAGARGCCRGQGAGLPEGDEAFEADDGAADIGPGEGEDGGGGLWPGRTQFGRERSGR